MMPDTLPHGDDTARAAADVRADLGLHTPPAHVPTAKPAGKKRGRPKGRKTTRATSTPPGTAPALDAPNTIAGDADAVHLLGLALRMVWKVGNAAARTGHREITDGEAADLASALAPVLDKYLPDAVDFAAEIALAATAGALWLATAPSPMNAAAPMIGEAVDTRAQ